MHLSVRCPGLCGCEEGAHRPGAGTRPRQKLPFPPGSEEDVIILISPVRTWPRPGEAEPRTLTGKPGSRHLKPAAVLTASLFRWFSLTPRTKGYDVVFLWFRFLRQGRHVAQPDLGPPDSGTRPGRAGSLSPAQNLSAVQSWQTCRARRSLGVLSGFCKAAGRQLRSLSNRGCAGGERGTAEVLLLASSRWQQHTGWPRPGPCPALLQGRAPLPAGLGPPAGPAPRGCPGVGVG